MFIPKIGEDPILTSIFFHMGWFNHQPVTFVHVHLHSVTFLSFMSDTFFSVSGIRVEENVPEHY